jgi:TolB-like protein/class 3 adenylate cyclase/Flp pilus assembly protein TadD
MPHEGTEHRRLAAIMFMDMVGYGAPTQSNEALALALLEEHRQLVRGIIPRYQGREIKTIGDGFLIEFASALAAVNCGVRIQRALRDRNAAQTPERAVWLRIGIHLGDIVGRENDIVGDGVNLAARIEPLAEPGGICISNAVFEQVHNKMDHPLIHLGAAELKNIQGSLVVYKVGIDEQPLSMKRVQVGASKFKQPPLATRRARRALALVVLVVVALNLGLFLRFGFAPQKDGRRTSGSAPAPWPDAHKSIAVLPFANLSANREGDAYLADGITEHLTTALSQVEGFRVPSRNSAAAFKNANEDLRNIGQRLGVDAILRGSVQKAGDKLHITAQLLNVTNDTHLWAKAFDGPVGELFVMQSEIGRQVAELLKGKLLEAEKKELLKHPTENFEAFRLYQIGRDHWAQETPAGLAESIKYFQQALALDPNYARAYAGLAGTYHLGGGRGFFPLKENVVKAKEAVLKALELDPELSDAQRELGALRFLYDWDWTAAGRALQKAISRNPNDVEAVSLYSGYLMAIGRINESLLEAQRALQLDPVSARYVALYANRLYRARRYDESLAQAGRAVEMNPKDASSYAARGFALLGKRKIQEVIRDFEEARRLIDRPATEGPLGYVYALAGRVEDARSLLNILKKPGRLEGGSAYFVALVLFGLKENDEAFTWLLRAKDERSAYMVGLPNDPVFDGVRADPRFKAILKDMGLRAQGE